MPRRDHRLVIKASPCLRKVLITPLSRCLTQ